MSVGESPRLSVKEAAARAGVSDKSVRRAIARGDLRAFRPRGQRSIVIFQADLDAWAFVPIEADRPQRAPAPRPAPANRSRGPARLGSVTRLRAIERGEA